MSWLSFALLVCAVLAVVGAEWPRLAANFGVDGRKRRARERRKSQLRLVRPPVEDDSEEFAASVERDLSQLPTIEEHDRG